MKNKRLKIFLLFLVVSALAGTASAQPGGALRRLPGGGGMRGSGASKGKDSLQKRNSLQDSITISFRYLDSSRMQKFDSSITDFTRHFPVPWYHYHLGNVGNATHSMIFPPLMKPGWDHGFHAFDAYNYNDYDTKFYNTTRPYTEIHYQIGSKLEQVLGILHTQNIMPNWNASFEYRLINSPGFFRNQNTNHNNYRFSSWYQSKNKRYQNFLVVVGNKLQSAENGGIKDDLNYLDSTSTFSERSTIPTRLGPVESGNQVNFFSSTISTGSKYTNASYIFRQQYDLIGNKDSIVTDSTVIPLFYPRLRAELTTSLKTYNYRFNDHAPQGSIDFYKTYYNIDTPNLFVYQDKWKDLTNDFSIYQFPDAKNSQQFFKAGAAFQMLTGTFDTGTVTNKYHNFFLHGEYRNKTRNKKWDVEAYGNFYVNGMNAGDYNAHVSLKRLISKKIGYLELGFANVNRAPSFIFDSTSSFYLSSVYHNFNKENFTEVFGSFDLPKLKAKIYGRYLLISNYTYFKDYKEPDQFGKLFNLLQVTAEKQFKIGGKWNWRTWMIVQQLTGNPPLNLPFLLTRNQVGYDGNLGFKNLLTSFGIELRYYTPYKADRYSPLTGQFFNQETQTVKMKLPDIAAYLHFRIKSFSAFVRLENLNSLDVSTGKFTRNNVVSPNYPYPGMQLRIGVYWSFVN
ncbi:MAG TPA: putative porin [Flavitalea sp.]|nr:putative porin [Flavitalea sp.]